MALTFTALGGHSFRVAGGQRALVVFPADAAEPAKETLTLLPGPEEQSRDNVISWPGEYNEYGISLKGIGHEEGQQASYIVEVEGVRCGFLSSPLRDWSDKQLEMAGDLDLLVLPTDDEKIAQKLIDEFDPRVLVLLPVKGDAYDVIAKSAGAKPESVTAEYKLKGQLPAEGREVVVLRK